MVRYAEDSVIGFQYEGEAKRFLEAMRERFAKFGLTLHPQKTRLIEFGRYAEQRRKEQGLGRPETFDFLGFTHCCCGCILTRRSDSRYEPEAGALCVMWSSQKCGVQP